MVVEAMGEVSIRGAKMRPRVILAGSEDEIREVAGAMLFDRSASRSDVTVITRTQLDALRAAVRAADDLLADQYPVDSPIRAELRAALGGA